MPDALKAQGLQGRPCLYGFEYPDAAVVAHDTAHGIEHPSDRDVHSWAAQRKNEIMRTRARELGILFSANLAVQAIYDKCREDVVYFAFMNKGNLVSYQCPNAQMIERIMRAMCVEGEPFWMVAR